MEPNPEALATQKKLEDTIVELTATIGDLKPKAEASSQNFERLKKLELEKTELEGKVAELTSKGEPPKFDPVKHAKEIDEKVNLRLAGFEPEHIAELEKFAKGAGISLTEASQSPFAKGGVDALKAAQKSKDVTPAPSNKSRMFNGKSLDEIYKSGTPAEKQAAWEADLKGSGVKNSE